MKTILLHLLCLCLVIPAIGQQRSQKVNAPISVSDSFRTRYPDGRLMKWGKTKKNAYKAYFMADETKSIAYFTPTGKWMMTKSYPIDLPRPVMATLDREYPYVIIGKIQKTDYSTKGTQFVVLLDTGPEVHKLLFTDYGEIKGKKVRAKQKKVSNDGR